MMWLDEELNVLNKIIDEGRTPEVKESELEDVEEFEPLSESELAEAVRTEALWEWILDEEGVPRDPKLRAKRRWDDALERAKKSKKWSDNPVQAAVNATRSRIDAISRGSAKLDGIIDFLKSEMKSTSPADRKKLRTLLAHAMKRKRTPGE